jgi:hypothetical protein
MLAQANTWSEIFRSPIKQANLSIIPTYCEQLSIWVPINYPRLVLPTLDEIRSYFQTHHTGQKTGF